MTYQRTNGLPLHVVHVVNGRGVPPRDIIELHVGTQEDGRAR
jgi:hypothetical protein